MKLCRNTFHIYATCTNLWMDYVLGSLSPYNQWHLIYFYSLGPFPALSLGATILAFFTGGYIWRKFIDELDTFACAFKDNEHSDRKTGLWIILVSDKITIAIYIEDSRGYTDYNFKIAEFPILQLLVIFGGAFTLTVYSTILRGTIPLRDHFRQGGSPKEGARNIIHLSWHQRGGGGGDRNVEYF